MTETGLKTRIVLVFAMMLAIAMFLQSIVVVFLGVRAAIKEDVLWSKRFLQQIVVSAPLAGEKGDGEPNQISYDKISERYLDAFSCMIVEVAGEVISEPSPCRFRQELLARSQQAKAVKASVTGYADEEWKLNLFGREVVLITVPLVDREGQVYGSITRSGLCCRSIPDIKKIWGLLFAIYW
ncbi:MAG: hypothetical protein VR65_07590 [Desulfobulbaceae bacterium BRH_c16a]|nr:MAG: hypothetical protein VR65_07590 [Desulfobulbaceae bacterium BRH_c16a]